jgi:CRP-like cAMP-binding protein
VLVLDGLLARDTELAGRVSTQLLGPGDVCDPWARAEELVPCAVRWRAHEPTRLAVLDGRFAIAARRWPSLAIAIQRRLQERADRLAGQTALLQLPSVDQRVLALLWQLADRFGRMGADGVVLPLSLTHRVIGQLVGARRSTVTLAFTDLVERGLVVKRGDEDPGWLLTSAGRASLLDARTG